MNAGARAIAWEFRRRHRLELVTIAYAIVFCMVTVVVVGSNHPVRMDPPNGLAGFIIAPVTMIFLYLVGVFSYGFAGDLAARQSIYPARMFALPVTSAGLAGWPMLYGTATSAGLWWATALLVRWPGGVDVYVPWVWPALLGAAYLAWTQALMWMPYGVRGLRVIVAALWLLVVDTIVLLALNYKARELVMAAMLAPQIPLAYVVAWSAVARARRGDVPDWRASARSGLSRTPRTSAVASDSYVVSGSSRTFSSPARAQTWFEWRRHGWTLPAMVAVVVPIELLLLFIPGNDTAPIVFLILFVALVTPPFMAVFAAPALSTSTPFTARRPLTTAELIVAKIKMTIWSTLAAWLLVVIFIGGALMLSGRTPVVVERARALIDVTGTLRAVAVVLFVFAALFASTWKHLVQSLCVGLTGRDRLIKSTVLLALIALVAAWPLGDWIVSDTTAQSVIWNGLPWILVVLVVFKMIAASWVAIRLYDNRVLSDRTLVAGAACWLATVLALYGVLEWFAASPLIPRYFLGAIAILSVPLGRVSAAPLALAWSRHQ